MDIKLKSNKRALGVFLSILLIAVMTFGIMATYPLLYKRSKMLRKPFYTQKYFAEWLYQGIYNLDWQLKRESGSPSQFYLPDLYYGNETEYSQNETETIAISEGTEEDGYYTFEYPYYAVSSEDYIRMFDDSIIRSIRNFDNLEYAAFNYRSGESISNSLTDLLGLVNSGSKNNILRQYQYLVYIEFDERGNMSIPNYYIDNDSLLKASEDAWKDIIISANKNTWTSENGAFSTYIETPTATSFIFAVPKTLGSVDWISNYKSNNELYAFNLAGFGAVYPFAVIVVFLGAIILYRVKAYQLGRGVLSRIPLEIPIIAAICIFTMSYSVADLSLSTYSGELAKNLSESLFIGVEYTKVFAYIINFVIIFLILAVVYFIGLSISPVFELGIVDFVKKRLLLSNTFKYISRSIKKIRDYILYVDMNKDAQNILVKILLVNFVILAFISVFWMFGIVFLIVYSICLFIFFKKYFIKFQKDYNVILKTAGKMAEGNLDININEETGIFNPIRDELAKIQQSFKKAVDTEVRSQNMKTELITNVSHDLKTPLTAIITYIDLLKDENLTSDERRQYIETLDKKSQRLKRLIEDLFEVSKASSKNTTLNIENVDLCALVKQVRSELSDKIENSGINFKWRIPDEKIMLELDGQKTCRVFENLIINISKYALKGTRAYIDIYREEDAVVSTLKNISAVEMDFKGEEMTERFVRGDKSRNTEGSGLGLAIAKSFVELQDGTFSVNADGDLFKVEIRWKNSEQNVEDKAETNENDN